MSRLKMSSFRNCSKKLLLILVAIVVCSFSIIKFFENFQMNIIFDVVAFLSYFFGFSTDINVYASVKYNVLQYSDFDWDYLINNPNKCLNRQPLIIIFVKTHPEHVMERDIIRQTWGNMSAWKQQTKDNSNVMLLFVLGISKTHTVYLQNMLENENKKHKDLIQGNFIEDFHNLTAKLVSHLKWPLEHCPNAKYWMTTDDDVFVHVGHLVAFLKLANSKMLYTGLVHAGSPRNNDKNSKYHVPYDVYHGSYYPSYCPGGGYVLSMDVVKMLYSKASVTPLLYIDDVYVGILANLAGITPQHYIMLWGENEISTDLCSLSLFITSHGYNGEQMINLFNQVMSLSYLDSNIVCWGKFFSWVNPHDLVYF